MAAENQTQKSGSQWHRHHISSLQGCVLINSFVKVNKHEKNHYRERTYLSSVNGCKGTWWLRGIEAHPKKGGGQHESICCISGSNCAQSAQGLADHLEDNRCWQEDAKLSCICLVANDMIYKNAEDQSDKGLHHTWLFSTTSKQEDAFQKRHAAAASELPWGISHAYTMWKWASKKAYTDQECCSPCIAEVAQIAFCIHSKVQGRCVHLSNLLWKQSRSDSWESVTNDVSAAAPPALRSCPAISIIVDNSFYDIMLILFLCNPIWQYQWWGRYKQGSQKTWSNTYHWELTWMGKVTRVLAAKNVLSL